MSTECSYKHFINVTLLYIEIRNLNNYIDNRVSSVASIPREWCGSLWYEYDYINLHWFYFHRKKLSTNKNFMLTDMNDELQNSTSYDKETKRQL